MTGGRRSNITTRERARIVWVGGKSKGAHHRGKAGRIAWVGLMIISTNGRANRVVQIDVVKDKIAKKTAAEEGGHCDQGKERKSLPGIQRK